MKQKALFLDRDGVINIDYGYVYQIKNFQFQKGIFNLAKQAIKNNYKIFVVTNQSGIGRGYYNESNFLTLTEWMCEKFQNKGAIISKVYFAPTHPHEGLGKYKTVDNRRKPNPGMILEAANEFDIDLKKSILLGDKKTDILAGLSAGVGCNILLGNQSKICDLGNSIHVISSLNQALHYL
jgi:D-glycero-D-manno-heptose 1,7-bisphosphate phosphatase